LLPLSPVPKGHKDFKGSLAHKVCRGFREPKGPREIRVTADFRGIKEIKEPKERKVSRG